MIQCFDLDHISHEQGNVAVEPTEKGKIARMRRNTVVVIVHPHSEKVVAFAFEGARKIEAETSVAAEMSADQLTVEKDIRTAVGTIELDVNLSPRPLGRRFDHTAIPA